jgi:hypothetical protein
VNRDLYIIIYVKKNIFDKKIKEISNIRLHKTIDINKNIFKKLK